MRVISRRLFFALPACAGLRASSGELLDGPNLTRFRTPSGELPPEVAWAMDGGVLRTRLDVERQCDLWTVETYEDFDLRFGWKVTPGANSGIKYLVQTWEADRLPRPQGELVHENSIGLEFQLIDDASRDGMHMPWSCSGALYNYLPPSEKAARPAGQWNTGRLKVQGGNVEHWLNERRVLAYRLDAPELRRALEKRNSITARILSRMEKRRTPIALQHHQSEIFFRDMRIERLS